jgi:predicted ATPase
MDEGDTAGAPLVHVRRLVLRNYRSVEEATISFPERLTYLVGPNGSGKSNVLDSLRLVSDSLTTSLGQALRERGGIDEVRWKSRGRPRDVAIDIAFGSRMAGGLYGFLLRSRRGGGVEVVREHCFSFSRERTAQARFEVHRGKVDSSEEALPPPPPDRLYLVTAASLPAFRPVYDALSGMGFYNINPAVIREPQPPDSGDLLARDGGNIASVLRRTAEDNPKLKAVIEEYLGAVVPGILGVDRRPVLRASLETLEFLQAVGEGATTRFYAQSMSDGTLRALGVLVAAFQQSAGGAGLSLVGIEEPEAAVHPAAAAVLRDALSEASESRQVLVTTHSPELLDDPDLDPQSILAVDNRNGATQAGQLDRAGLSALKDRLYTAGELLRAGQLMPETETTTDGP